MPGLFKTLGTQGYRAIQPADTPNLKGRHRWTQQRREMGGIYRDAQEWPVIQTGGWGRRKRGE